MVYLKHLGNLEYHLIAMYEINLIHFIIGICLTQWLENSIPKEINQLYVLPMSIELLANILDMGKVHIL